jgi:hypothetical protein
VALVAIFFVSYKNTLQVMRFPGLVAISLRIRSMLPSSTLPSKMLIADSNATFRSDTLAKRFAGLLYVALCTTPSSTGLMLPMSCSCARQSPS